MFWQDVFRSILMIMETECPSENEMLQVDQSEAELIELVEEFLDVWQENIRLQAIDCELLTPADMVELLQDMKNHG